ncbi:hypothetical protein ACHWQZ_G011571 [Mnemiopsis leidyi]
MPICGIHTSLCGKAEEFLSFSPEKLEKLESIRQQLLSLEEKKLENGNLVRLLEEEIRKQQIKLSIKPKTSAFLVSRARNSSYWVSSNPELYKTLQSSSPELDRTELEGEDNDKKAGGDTGDNGDDADETASNWSEISERYVVKMPTSRRKMPPVRDAELHGDEEVRTISSDIVHHLLHSTGGAKDIDPEYCKFPSKRASKDRVSYSLLLTIVHPIA